MQIFFISFSGGRIKKHVQLLTIFISIVTILGILQVGSASRHWAMFKFHDPFYFLKRQLIFASLGGIGFIFSSKLHLEKIQHKHFWFYLLTCLALILVLIPGIGVSRNGSRSWFKVGSILIQPSEFFKLAMIFTASAICTKITRFQSFRHDLLGLLILVGLGFGLIMLQPDFGSGLVMFCSIVVIVFVAGCPYRYFVIGTVIGGCGLVGLILSAPYRLERILSFVDPWSDPLGSGFQMIQSLYAIAPGGLFGRGFNASIQKQFYLPEPQTDFIFSIFAEEWGLLGCSFLLFCYAMICYEGFMIAKTTPHPFLAYCATGVIALFTIQVIINLGVVVGLFPITGITLPLFSYGGSSMVVTMVSLGLLVSIGTQKE